METDKPIISILMAVYEPRMDWLREQLDSLNAQTYPNLRLYVRDDCSPTVPFGEIEELVRECITAFPWSIRRNEENLGSNRTFERLTEEAEGEYFAYCDQDDVWMPEKLSILEREIGSAGMICSDVIPVDGTGKRLADSITVLRPRHVFKSGPNLGGSLIYRNFVIGCTMLIRSEIAKSAVPFAESMVHDHFLAFHCAMDHAIAVSSVPTIYYRLHGGNQTGVLAHITTKQDYLEKHLMPFCRRVEELSARYTFPALEKAERWADARVCNALHKPGGARALWRERRQNTATSYFELIVLRLPLPLFQAALRRIRKGKGK